MSTQSFSIKWSLFSGSKRVKVCHVCPNKVDVQTSDSVTETSKLSRGLRIIPSCKQKICFRQIGSMCWILRLFQIVSREMCLSENISRNNGDFSQHGSLLKILSSTRTKGLRDLGVPKSPRSLKVDGWKWYEMVIWTNHFPNVYKIWKHPIETTFQTHGLFRDVLKPFESQKIPKKRSPKKERLRHFFRRKTRRWSICTLRPILVPNAR